MKSQAKNWTKEEFKIYILLLCAKADKIESSEEIELIKSKTRPETFEKIYNEFSNDKKSNSFKKIEAAIVNLHYGSMELIELREEILQVYMADNAFSGKEKYLDKILDNIIY